MKLNVTSAMIAVCGVFILQAGPENELLQDPCLMLSAPLEKGYFCAAPVTVLQKKEVSASSDEKSEYPLLDQFIQKVSAGSITAIQFHHTQFVDIKAFKNFVNTQRLSVGRNQLKTIDSVLNFKYIKELSAPYNAIESLPAEFGTLKTLEVLDLTGNSIEDITPLKGLTLKVLRLGGNAIRTIDILETLIASLKIVDVKNNPLQEASLQRVIACMAKDSRSRHSQRKKSAKDATRNLIEMREMYYDTVAQEIETIEPVLQMLREEHMRSCEELKQLEEQYSN
jgi:hypothetical protein